MLSFTLSKVFASDFTSDVFFGLGYCESKNGKRLPADPLGDSLSKYLYFGVILLTMNDCFQCGSK